MRARRFVPLTLLSCGAWALGLIGLGYSFSGAIGVIIGRVQRAGIVLLIALVITCAIALILYLLEFYVVGRRVPEMEPLEPPLIHEKLHETLHPHEAADAVKREKDSSKEEKSESDPSTQGKRRSKQIGSHQF